MEDKLALFRNFYSAPESKGLEGIIISQVSIDDAFVKFPTIRWDLGPEYVSMLSCVSKLKYICGFTYFLLFT